MAKTRKQSEDLYDEIVDLLQSKSLPVRKKAEDDDILIPTNLTIFDIYSGGGITLGKFHLFLANPGAGKSTLALQCVSAIQRKYEDAIILIIDTEAAMSRKRFQQLGVKLDKVLYCDAGITLEKVMESIEGIIAIKREKIKKDPSYLKVPTIIVWDSIAQTPSEKELKTNDINQTLGLNARILSAFFRTITGYLAQYNITLLAVNQLREKPKLGPFDGINEINLPGLENKSIPGGKAQIFAAFSVLLMKPYTQLKPDKSGSFGFQGAITECKFLKNKYVAPFHPFYMVLDYANGFSEFWTNFLYLRDVLKVVGASGGYYSMEGYPKKFHLKKAYEYYQNDPKFKEVFDEHVETLKEVLRKQIETSKNLETQLLEENIDDRDTNNSETT